MKLDLTLMRSSLSKEPKRIWRGSLKMPRWLPDNVEVIVTPTKFTRNNQWLTVETASFSGMDPLIALGYFEINCWRCVQRSACFCLNCYVKVIYSVLWTSLFKILYLLFVLLFISDFSFLLHILDYTSFWFWEDMQTYDFMLYLSTSICVNIIS